MKTKAPILALLATACGTWVQYDGDDPSGSPSERLPVDSLATVSEFDHLLWDSLIASFTTDDGNTVAFDYVSLARDEEARLLLQSYLDQLAAIRSGQLEGQNQRLAYWLNAYNALMVDAVLRNFEGDLSYSVADDNFIVFSVREHVLGDGLFSLDEIEHAVLRFDTEHSSYSGWRAREDELRALHDLVWNGDTVDSRLHMVINCASLSCPDLYATAPRALKPREIDEQMNAASTRFLDDPFKGANGSGVSRLFDWFRKDFVNDAGSVDAFIAAHRTAGASGTDSSSFIDYDWSLNAVR